MVEPRDGRWPRKPGSPEGVPRPVVGIVEEAPPPKGPARPPNRRPIRPLPEGPYPVPLSTIDWLVSRESPAARYVALRDLVARSTKDIEVRKARLGVPRDVFVRDLLPHLKRRLAPNATPSELERRYDGGIWLALFLLEVGGDTTLPELHHAADVLLARWEHTFVELERTEGPPRVRPIFWTVCRTLARLGLGADPRILAAARCRAVSRVAGSAPPRDASPLVKDLLLFAAIPEAKRPDEVRAAITFTVERTLAAVGAGLLPDRFGFPTGEGSDLLEALEALADLGVPLRPPVPEALALVASRADHRARWKLERSLNETLPVALERAGELSRWVTLRALRVLSHFVGLTIPGVK